MLVTKICSKCGNTLDVSKFCPSKNFFFSDGYLPICNDCIERLIKKYKDDWSIVDKLCQYADIPFIPQEWNKVYTQNKEKAFPFYNKIFLTEKYEGLNWKIYYNEFKKLEQDGLINRELPLLSDREIAELQRKWGPNYSVEELDYLENLYNGIISTQNVNGGLSIDQSLKLCKISLEIDNRIREGSEIDKLLSSYDKLVKIGDFTPKNIKNTGDFESVGELYAYLEKTGWINRYYDGAKKDVIDETIANIQNYNRRLWVNESGLSEDIEKRLEALQHAQNLEDMYDISDEYDEDKYEAEGIQNLKEEFEIDI